MKNILVMISILIGSVSASAELLTIKCEKSVGITLTSDFSEGTISIFVDSAPELYRITQKEKTAEGTAFKAVATPQGDLDLFIHNFVVGQDGARGYPITIIWNFTKFEEVCAAD